jgi:hypothetical protein
MKRRLVITMHGWWHAGTGRGEGTAVAARVARTPAGLPMVAGKTLKGLCREAMTRAMELGWLPAVTEDQLFRWFGRPSLLRSAKLERSRQALEERVAEVQAVREFEAARFDTKGGDLWFSNATLGRDDAGRAAWEAWAPGNIDKVAELYGELASTAIDERGLAKEGTLRVIEVAVPLTLYADVICDDEQSFRSLETALPLLRALGSHRTRGLGRASFVLEAT